MKNFMNNEETEKKEAGLFKQLLRKSAVKKAASLVVAATVVVGASTVMFASCKKKNGGDSSSIESVVTSSVTSSSEETPPEESTSCVVTFNTNGGSAFEAITMDIGAVLDLSSYKPTKESGYFVGWYLDAELTKTADLNYVATGDVTLYAKWSTDERYVLTFETNGGSTIESVSYRANDRLAKPEDPTRENYVFGGWYSDAACTKEVSFYTEPQMPKANMTLYAKWIALNGFIFNVNGSVVDSVYGVTGDLVGAITEPTMEGKIFTGWYTSETTQTAATKADLTIFQKGVTTVYAGWRDQVTDVTVTLHLNYKGQDRTLTLTGDEGESLDAETQIASFLADINATFADSYKGSSNLAEKPIYKFSTWAYDAMGSQRFDGKFPGESVDLYAVWSRSAAYCEVTFVNEDNETTIYVDKNTEIDATILDANMTAVKNEYEARGCTVDGFYTTSGSTYKAGDKIAMDMRLIPNVYTANLSYEYVTLVTNLGAEVKGYMLTGYDKTGAEQNADKDNLLLLVPEYYNGTQGSLPVVAVGENAFKGYNISEATLPNGIYSIGVEAFSGTAITEINLPSKLYSIGDNAFANSALTDVTYNSVITEIGCTVYAGTVFESNMFTEGGFIYFDEMGEIIYKYVGTETAPEIENIVRIIAGGAFMNNTTVKSLVLPNSVRQAGDYAFAGSAVESVTIGQSFGGMGIGVFQGCTSLKTVEFTFKYTLSALGTAMFKDCTALTDINLSFLDNLKMVGTESFYGCTALTKVTFGDSLVTVGVSAFENCTSLQHVEFGKDDEGTSASKLATISNRAFAGCTSLKRVILRGDLINNTIVSFGKNVFVGANSPILYVKDNYVDNWSNNDENTAPIYTYVDMYKAYLPTEYRNMDIRPIDSAAPTAGARNTFALNAGTYDLASYLRENGTALELYQDNRSEGTACEVRILAVAMYQTGATVNAIDGKYNLTAGEYTVAFEVEDECGNISTFEVRLIING